MARADKSRTSFQDKLAKQNEINRQMLVRELSKLDETKKQDMRTLENAKQRFRSRYKKFGLGAGVSFGSKAVDVRMYETHNPGFCYHCNGAIKESGPVSSAPETIVDPAESYESVRSMLFTNGEVDVEKLVCLHVLAAYTKNSTDDQLPVSILNSSSRFDRAFDENERFSGAWNNFLPCYVIDVERNGGVSTSQVTTRRNNRKRIMENETPRDFELNYEIYASDNADVLRTVDTDERAPKMRPRKLGKTPIIPPHVYAILGPSHQLRVRRSMIENPDDGSRVESVNRSSIHTIIHDDNDDNVFAGELRSFECDTRDITDRVIFHACARDRDSNATNFTRTSANATGNSLGAFRDFPICEKIDRSITMLKGNPRRIFEDLTKDWEARDAIGNTTKAELVTIKSSCGAFCDSGTKSACKNKDFRRSGQARDAFSSVYSWDSMIDSSRCKTIKYRNFVYLNSPIKTFALKYREYRVVDILVNNQIQALVHSVLEVLDRVNPEKVQRVLETARDVRKIRDIFGRADIQNFVESLLGQPIVTSPRSFVVSRATAINEIDSRLEDLIGGELVAMTMELPAAIHLESLVAELRHKVFGIKGNSDLTNFDDCNDDRIRGEEKTFDKLNETDSKANDQRAIDSPRENADRIANESQENEEKSIAKIFHKNRHRSSDDPEAEQSSIDKSSDVSKIADSSLGNEKNLFQSPEINNEIRHLDIDRAILRRMTSSRGISAGKTCAALKNRRINDEGLIRESIKSLSRGTLRSKFAETLKNQEEQSEQSRASSGKLTGPVLAKVQRDIAEHETKRRLDSFFHVQRRSDWQ